MKVQAKGVCALRGYFGPPVRPKDKSCFSLVSSYLCIRTSVKVNLAFTVAMVTKMAAKKAENTKVTILEQI